MTSIAQRLSSIALFVMGALFGGVIRVRELAYNLHLLPIYRARLPVVCVGNVTVGGNGKTPFCAWMAASLTQRGFRPVILTRGYGGSEPGPYLVQRSDSPARVGDEALLLAQSGHVVVVSNRRASGARWIAKNDYGDTILLDDGLQHRALARDVNILLVDVSSPQRLREMSHGSMIPHGKLREPPSQAFSRVDICLGINRGTEHWDARTELRRVVPTHIPIFLGEVRSMGFFDSDGTCVSPPSQAISLAAIASPEPFFQTVRDSGIAIEEELSFPDHHPFTISDLQELGRRFPQCQIVCTTKDAVKLLALGFTEFVQLKTEIAVTHSEALFDLLVSAIVAKNQLSQVRPSPQSL